MGWQYLLLFTVIALALSAVGFYKYVYFLSIGYGFAVAGLGITFCILSLCGVFEAGAAHYLMFALLIIYGARLSGFLLAREIKNAAYRKTLKEATGNDKHVPFFVKFSIWLCVGVLYVAQTSPVFYRMYNGGKVSVMAWVGIAVCGLSVVLESVADRQKSKQKAVRPDMVATKGLYRIVRCPNYFAEILFWTGVFLYGTDVLAGAGQWIMAAVAYVCIVYIMFNGAQRLEKRQMKRYGDNEEYRNYTEKTPIILPLIPIYHLNPQNKSDKK